MTEVKFKVGDRVLVLPNDEECPLGEAVVVDAHKAESIKIVVDADDGYWRVHEKFLLPVLAVASPLSKQVGGDHYKNFAIQPAEFIHRNGIGFLEGNVIKYVTRYKAKNGVQDLEKAKHYLEMIIALETGEKK